MGASKFICQNEFYFKLFNMSDDKIIRSGAQYDQRYSSQVQAKYCFQNFVDHKRCEELTPCDWFKNAFMAACPQFWVEGFETAIEKGAFQVKDKNMFRYQDAIKKGDHI